MLRELVEIYNLAYLIMLKGGWVIFVWALLYMLYKMYMDFIQIRWYNTLQWEFLKISVPRENEKSPLAFEQIFNHLHSIHGHLSWAEQYIEGQFQIWITWELASLGGVIGNYVRVIKKHRSVVEAAIYAQFPEAEITEAEDYFVNLPPYNPETSEFDIFAYSYTLIRQDEYPIRTYHDFEHTEADTIVDPVEGLWEELSAIAPYEMYVIQYVLRPIGNEWKKKGYELVQKLKGVPGANAKPHDPFGAFLGKILGPILDIFIRPSGEVRPAKEDPPSLMLHLSEGEKAVIGAVERNLSKWGYQTKIHCLYLAPREKYNPGHINTAVVGSFKGFGAAELNALKPLLKRWTKVDYWAFEHFEKPITRLRLNYRKRKYMNLIRKRWYFHGPPSYILNAEELASLIHFPRTEVTVPQIEKVTVTKVKPPPELPVAPELNIPQG